LRNKAFSAVMVAVIMGVVLTVAAGLPFSKFGVKSVDAQYDPLAAACAAAAENQIRFYGDVVAYADPDLTEPVVTIPGSTLLRQKYLVCPGTLNETSVQIFLAGSLAWVRVGTGDIVPRSFRDDQ
jgi:hypothetical protein